jgi:hypothetical protein
MSGTYGVVGVVERWRRPAPWSQQPARIACRAGPVLPADEVDVVAAAGEARAELAVAALGAPADVRVDGIVDERDAH